MKELTLFRAIRRLNKKHYTYEGIALFAVGILAYKWIAAALFLIGMAICLCVGNREES